MNDEIHFLIVGMLYLIIAVPIWWKNRNNRYDRGYHWILFSIAHGLDEIFDYFASIDTIDFFIKNHILFEKLELAAFFLTATFLILASLVKLGWFRSNESLLHVLPIPAVVVVFFLSFNELVLDTIGELSITVLDFEYSYTTLIFGVLAALPLVYAYIYEFIVLIRKTIKLKDFNNKQVFFSLFNGLLFIFYIIGEVYASVFVYLVYLEVITIFFVMLSPLEVILGTNIQLFLIYDKHGLPVMHTKFNTRIDDDLIVLVTGFLTAINSMVKEELKLGNLDTIQTENGLLITHYDEEYIFSILVNEDRMITREKFESIIPQVLGQLPKYYDGFLENKQELERMVLGNFVSS
ncbi:MAG: hypothetical protein INQ03_03810 [Candidatus Heimdallarchaeota archaeon]|nr:hypothetical protein [Candidatus Heimdallarchaeota archaeon]